MNEEFSITTQNLTITPKANLCYCFVKNNHCTRRSIWLVPHVIKHRDESEIITWRCNMGQTCESDCLYAMAKNKPLQTMNPISLVDKILLQR